MDEIAVLVLNYTFEPLHFTNARRAITLLLAGQAEAVDASARVVQAACVRCNLRKGNRLPDEVGMRLIRDPIHPKFVFSTHMLRHPHAHSLLDSWRKYLLAVPTPS